MYKNILIVTSNRDDIGSSLSFYKDIQDIEPEYQDMVIAAIERKNYENDDLWSSYGDCGSDRGYIFQGGYTLPITVEHIVTYIC